MAEPIRIAKGILVPEGAIEWRAVRSSGPGGQNVNKVASKVELRVDLGARERASRPRRGRGSRRSPRAGSTPTGGSW